MKPWGSIKGQEVGLYTLANAGGMQADISNYGGTIVSLRVPDRNGTLADVALGYRTLDEYAVSAYSPYFGALIGRVGNRIARGRFSLHGRDYRLATNNEPGGLPCHLHGGLKGFDKMVWKAEPFKRNGAEALRLFYTSADGEEGYPGNLEVIVTYSLGADGALSIEYEAHTDKPTPVNLTNHCYFNLKGEGEGDILDHLAEIRAANYTPVDKGLIPVGTIEPVAGTPFDFAAPHRIGERIEDRHEQLVLGAGYDHNWVLDGQGGLLSLAARVTEPVSGRVLEVLTTEPGVQFYSGNFLPLPGALPPMIGKSGKPYLHRGGFCLETQHYPDSPNQPSFPSLILNPGEVRRSVTQYRFSASAPVSL
ncbi:MAG: aldose epimerase family protein [Spirochaetota bacterium]